MASDPEYVVDPDLSVHLIKQGQDRVGEFLARCTVFLAVRDERRQETRVAGSGVVADLHGTKVVLTAGHVLRDFRREFEDGRMILSVNQKRGSFSVRGDSELLFSEGGDLGPDAGVLIIPPDLTESYFQLNGFTPVRATTLRITLPPENVASMVGGYPSQGTEFFAAEGPGGPYSWVHARLVLIAARRLPSDQLHHWLDLSKLDDGARPPEPGDLNGMSGCGFWSFEISKDLVGDAHDVRSYLHGVHTATLQDENGTRLRQTPIAHHLRLLANHSDELRAKVMTLWPELVLG